MPELTAVLSAGRVLLFAYATVATVLATACLALHVITHYDRRAPRRAALRRRRADRSLFVRLDPELDTP
ncbi:MAG TPA: hypothetical protein VNK05_09795 [Chloroflexota bacterium]|jgi:hypothetical protein|nr:hypothetical protein [Chloroflexota bacterium]